MIDPAPCDIGRRVRLWTRWKETKLGSLVRFDPTWCWIQWDGDPVVRSCIRCLLTWVK